MRKREREALDRQALKIAKAFAMLTASIEVDLGIIPESKRSKRGCIKTLRWWKRRLAEVQTHFRTSYEYHTDHVRKVFRDALVKADIALMNRIGELEDALGI